MSYKDAGKCVHFEINSRCLACHKKRIKKLENKWLNAEDENIRLATSLAECRERIKELEIELLDAKAKSIEEYWKERIVLLRELFDDLKEDN